MTAAKPASRPGPAGTAPHCTDDAPGPRELDPRIHPVRPDLVAAHLAGEVTGRPSSRGRPCTVQAESAAMRRAPRADSMMISQALFGETLLVYDLADGWAWCQNTIDGYVGYVAADALCPGTRVPTHRIAALRAHIYARPDLKSAPVGALCRGSLVVWHQSSGPWVALAGSGGWVNRAALAPISRRWPDLVATALVYRNCPYLWGGRSALGLDCSGLVQRALLDAGIMAPRDSDQQLAVGQAIDPDQWAPQRGDLVFFPGHVGLMADGDHLVHANAAAMAVSYEPVRAVHDRLMASDGAGISAIRRL